MDATQRTVLITGANGFLGRACCEYFTKRGYSVRALVRDPKASQALSSIAADGIFACDLPDNIDPAAFQDSICAVIHCAFDTRFENQDKSKRTNIEGTQNLVALSKKAQVKQFVFISSLAAHSEAQSFYGKSKLQLEHMLANEPFATIIKPGTIMGNGGLFQRTRELVNKMPILPVFFASGKRLQTVWIDDLCQGIFNAVERNLTGEFVLAEETGVDMKDFYRGIGSLDGKKVGVVPFPGNLTLFVLRAFEKLGIRLPISSENLLGIKHLRSFSSKTDSIRLGTDLRSFYQSLDQLKKLEKK